MVTPRHMSKRVKRVKQAGSAQKPKQGRSGVATADPWNHVKGVPRGTISEDLWNAFPETKSVSKYYTCTRCARYFTHDVMHYECSGREGGPPEPSDIVHCDRVPSGAPIIGKGDHSLQILAGRATIASEALRLDMALGNGGAPLPEHRLLASRLAAPARRA